MAGIGVGLGCGLGVELGVGLGCGLGVRRGKNTGGNGGCICPRAAWLPRRPKLAARRRRKITWLHVQNGWF